MTTQQLVQAAIEKYQTTNPEFSEALSAAKTANDFRDAAFKQPSGFGGFAARAREQELAWGTDPHSAQKHYQQRAEEERESAH